MLVGAPGVGKTRVITHARAYLSEITGLRIVPTSVTAASLVDYLAESSRTLHYGGANEIYNSAVLLQDDWQALMATFDKTIISSLTIFYDANHYSESRRTNSLKHTIESPQLNIIAGTTPVGLMDEVPLSAWGQGFTSRVILVYSSEKKIIGDDFVTEEPKELPPDMVDDLLSIAALAGPFKVTDEYRQLVNTWRQGDEVPKPNHPKLLHYNTRRRAMLYKLSMVVGADASDELVLTGDCFRKALGILGMAETNMPAIFEQMATPDAQALDEIVAWVATQKGVTQEQILNRMSRIFPVHSLGRSFTLLTMIGKLVMKDGKFFSV